MFSLYKLPHSAQLHPCHQRRVECHVHSNAAITQPTSLLDWLVTKQGATPYSLKVERTYQGSDRGWGMVAQQDIPPDDVVLSVPLPAAITSQGASEAEWSVAMIAPILTALKHQSTSALLPWLQTLPDFVPLPWLYWNDDVITELQDHSTIEECFSLTHFLHLAIERYPDSTDTEIAWALSLVHSRSFISSGFHVWVPGVDLCNHTLEPNARVRLTHNPDACQGDQALEEVAPPSGMQRPSCFELVAGEDGISAGEEVTISYGKWPNDVFLLFFGFVPENNPHDSVIVFENLYEIVQFVGEQAFGDQNELKNDESVMEVVAAMLENDLGGQDAEGEYFRLVVTASGVDGRLLQCLEAALKVLNISEEAWSVPRLLAARCQQVLESYPTSLEEDENLVKSVESEDLRTAIRYRIGKKKVLIMTVAHFT